MSIIALIGNLAFTLANIIVGIRMCLLARRTRQLPETLIGAALVSGGVFANTVRWLVFALQPREPYLSAMGYMVRGGAATCGVLLLILAWRVFRPDARWAKVLVGVASVFFTGYVFRDLVLGSRPMSELIRHPFHWMNTLTLLTPYVWVAWESLRYQAGLQKRWRIGLPADLLVAAQMRFWAMAMGSIGAMLLSLDVIRVAGVMMGRPISPANLISLLGLNAAISLWMAFFTPRWYVRRIRTQELSPPL
jgi:hypothetical protein